MRKTEILDVDFTIKWKYGNQVIYLFRLYFSGIINVLINNHTNVKRATENPLIIIESYIYINI